MMGLMHLPFEGSRWLGFLFLKFKIIMVLPSVKVLQLSPHESLDLRPHLHKSMGHPEAEGKRCLDLYHISGNMCMQFFL